MSVGHDEGGVTRSFFSREGTSGDECTDLILILGGRIGEKGANDAGVGVLHP